MHFDQTEKHELSEIRICPNGLSAIKQSPQITDQRSAHYICWRYGFRSSLKELDVSDLAKNEFIKLYFAYGLVLLLLFFVVVFVVVVFA